MGRRSQIRFIKSPPNNFYFNTRKEDASAVILTLAEFEAMRLKHYVNLPQKSAPTTMGISQPTFSRILESAHKKVTQALILGKDIRVYGGNIEYKKRFMGYGCLDCNFEWEEPSAERDKKTPCPKCSSAMTYYLIREQL